MQLENIVKALNHGGVPTEQIHAVVCGLLHVQDQLQRSRPGSLDFMERYGTLAAGQLIRMRE